MSHTLDVFLVTSPLECPSKLWVSFFNHGTTSPIRLLGLNHLEDIFDEVALHGIVEEKPLLLSNALTKHNSYLIHYLPYLKTEQANEALADSLHELGKNLRNSLPDAIGLYVDSRLFVSEQSRKYCIQQFVETMGKNVLSLQKIYLYIGKNDYAELLNHSLDVRRLAIKEALTVTVFH